MLFRAEVARDLGVPIIMHDYITGGFTSNTSLDVLSTASATRERGRLHQPVLDEGLHCDERDLQPPSVYRHSSWSGVFTLGFHTLGLYVHNDVMQAFGTPECEISLSPVFGQWLQVAHGQHVGSPLSCGPVTSQRGTASTSRRSGC